jgi:prepilin-type N-terminal cleavage/methylation domain-containing protein
MQLVKSVTGTKKRGGFTLLEIVFVLSMVAVLVTWMTVSIATVESEQKLREAAESIELLAKRGLNVAVAQQRPYELTITETTVSLAPKYTYSSDDINGVDSSELNDEAETGFVDVSVNEPMASDVLYEIKRWRSDDWQPLEKNKTVVLMLSPLGLIEPISIRCSSGKSWIMHELHPLTAGMRDEEMSIEKE